MSEYKKWTEENPVTDELLLEHWGAFVAYVAGVASRTYNLSDREDIVANIKLRLLGIPADKRMYEGYVKMVVNNALRDGIKDALSRGATPGRNWKEYRFSTLDFHQATPRKDGEEDMEDIDRALPIPLSPEGRLIDRIALLKAIESLKPKERDIVTLFFGMGEEHLSMEDAALRVDLSQAFARVVLKKALRKLNKALSG